MCSPPRQINHRRHHPVPLRYFEIMSLPWALCSRTSQAGNQDQWLSPKKEDKNTTFSHWWFQKFVLVVLQPRLHAAATTLPQCSMLAHAVHALNVLRCWHRLLFSRALWVGRPCSCHGCCGCLGIHPRDAKLHLAVGRKPASHQAWRVFLSFFKLG